MRIITTPELIKHMTFISLTDVSKEDVVERLRVKTDGDGKQIGMKTDRNGNSTYSVSIKVLNEEGREERDVYLSVREPSNIPALTPLVPVGEVEINVYETRTGVVITIVADKFVPATAPAATPNMDKVGGEK